MRKRKISLTTTQIIMLGFLAVILAGSGLLALPFSAAAGVSVSYADALFTATTATCVTGILTLPVAGTWSAFGQAVILLLIQIGGLGVVTVMTGVMVALQRRIGLADRLLIQDSFNLNTMSGLVRFIEKVLFGTLLAEAAGALLYMTVFVPAYGLRGVWIAVFTSVSAFCNAGFDLFGTDSLCGWAVHPLVNAVTGALTVLGGLGFVVWWDVLDTLPKWKKQGRRCLRGLTLHSKIALFTTAVLLAGGTALFLMLEWNNPLTLQGRPFGEKLQLAAFQAVTTRSAGFYTLPQQNLSPAAALVSWLLMFIGGSPVGTAGGIKTVTAAVLAVTAAAAVRGRGAVTLFGRRLSRQAVSRAIAVTSLAFVTLFGTAVLLALCTDAPLPDILYEAAGAATTVGLTRGLAPSFGTAGRLVLLAAMYLGRVGPISMAVAFNRKNDAPDLVTDPVEEISVG
jgi:trk system potassium uptake protein TrkH